MMMMFGIHQLKMVVVCFVIVVVFLPGVVELVVVVIAPSGGSSLSGFLPRTTIARVVCGFHLLIDL